MLNAWPKEQYKFKISWLEAIIMIVLVSLVISPENPKPKTALIRR